MFRPRCSRSGKRTPDYKSACVWGWWGTWVEYGTVVCPAQRYRLLQDTLRGILVPFYCIIPELTTLR
jgi:hypothetical protein